jgi:hypothetical protein
MRNSPDQAILERAKRFEAQALEEILILSAQGFTDMVSACWVMRI